jgi:hypothetical protein
MKNLIHHGIKVKFCLALQRITLHSTENDFIKKGVETGLFETLATGLSQKYKVPNPAKLL